MDEAINQTIIGDTKAAQLLYIESSRSRYNKMSDSGRSANHNRVPQIRLCLRKFYFTVASQLRCVNYSTLNCCKSRR